MTEMQKISAAAPAETSDGFSRRAFLVGSASTGLVLGYSALPNFVGSGAALAAANLEPTVWYNIDPKGIVNVTCAKAEMGQHVSSAMAQLIAEELEADWKDVRVTFPDNDPKYVDPVLGAIITGGSWSVHYNFDAMSRAGAAGRMTLIAAGAPMVGGTEADCYAQNSHVINKKSGKSVSYAQIVASGKASKTWTADEMKAIKLKTPDQYRLLGQSVQQLDIPPKTNGTAKYGIDTAVPGMVYGKLVLPPVRYGATVKSIDDSAAKKVPGYIKVFALDDKTTTTTGWVIAVAKSYDAARRVAAAVKVDWDHGPNGNVSDQTILDEARRLQKDGSTGLLWVKEGDASDTLIKAAKVLEAEYTTSINIHAPLEPMNATAWKDGNIWHVVSGNQFATRSGALAAGALGIDPKLLVLHQRLLGGGFGRRLEGDMLIPAVLASKEVGMPVKVIYAREDDMTMDFTRPLTYQKVRAGLDKGNKLVAMEHDVVSAWPTARWGIPAFLTPSVDKKGALDSFTVNGSDYWYTVPNHTVRNFLNEVAQKATPSGQLRAVAPGWTFWAVESMLDELAHASGQDPVAFRMAMLDGAGNNAGGAKRLAAALQTAVGKSGYGTKQLPKGEGLGVACVSSQERATATWTACVAHVAVASSGEITVKKLTLAMDVGTAVNPDGVRAQIEGSSLFGTSIALYEKASMKSGGIEQTNFDTYTPLRMSQVPELDITIIANGDPATGCGEPAVTVVAPAIGNAVFNAVGARVRSLPMTADAVKAAMKA